MAIMVITGIRIMDMATAGDGLVLLIIVPLTAAHTMEGTTDIITTTDITLITITGTFMDM